MASWDAPASFDDYVHARHRELLRFAHVLCGDPHLATDLVQDALERTGLHWRRLRKQDDPEGYVRRIIVNQYLNQSRRLRREHLVADVPDRADPGSTGQRDEQIWQLHSSRPKSDDGRMEPSKKDDQRPMFNSADERLRRVRSRPRGWHADGSRKADSSRGGGWPRSAGTSVVPTRRSTPPCAVRCDVTQPEVVTGDLNGRIGH
jgi:DNA-directed RNA polymerase specialized sigma24 family protein